MSPRVLVVDDDDGIRKLLVVALRRAGIDVETASDGCDALRKLGQTPYAVVILDLMMPCVDGRAVLAEIRRRPEPQPAIIITSAIGEPEDIEEADVVLAKPFDLMDLIGTVKRFLAAQADRRTA